MATLIQPDGTTTKVQPAEGTEFTLEELKRYIGGGWIEIVRCSVGFLVIDEEGRLKGMDLNPVATEVYGRDIIVGPALLCRPGEIS